MKNTTKLLCGIAICGLAFTPVMAGEHHGHNDGLHLAAGIVGIIRNVLAPAPVVIHETVPAPAPVVIRETPPPPPPREMRHHEPRHETRRHEPARHERRNPAPEPRRNDKRGGRR